MQERLFFGLAVSLGHALLLMCMLNTQSTQEVPISVQATMVRFDQPADLSPANDKPADALKPSLDKPTVDQPRMSDMPTSTNDLPATTTTPATADSNRPVDAGALPAEAAPTHSQTTNTAAASTATPKTVSITDVQYARAPSRDYPRAAMLRGEEGRVSMKVLVGQDGKPEAVHITRSSGYEALDRAAVQSMKTSTFKPYSENGVPQSVWVHTTLEYYLESAT